MTSMLDVNINQKKHRAGFVGSGPRGVSVLIEHEQDS